MPKGQNQPPGVGARWWQNRGSGQNLPGSGNFGGGLPEGAFGGLPQVDIPPRHEMFNQAAARFADGPEQRGPVQQYDPMQYQQQMSPMMLTPWGNLMSGDGEPVGAQGYQQPYPPWGATPPEPQPPPGPLRRLAGNVSMDEAGSIAFNPDSRIYKLAQLLGNRGG